MHYGAGLQGLQRDSSGGGGGWRCHTQDGAAFSARRVASSFRLNGESKVRLFKGLFKEGPAELH